MNLLGLELSTSVDSLEKPPTKSSLRGKFGVTSLRSLRNHLLTFVICSQRKEADYPEHSLEQALRRHY